jgi:hypothetical protein
MGNVQMANRQTLDAGFIQRLFNAEQIEALKSNDAIQHGPNSTEPPDFSANGVESWEGRLDGQRPNSKQANRRHWQLA